MQLKFLRWMAIFALVLGLALAQTVTFDGKTYGPEDPLPPDPDLQALQLENGLTVFLLHNTEPENRVEYALAVRAGSLEEEDDQRGLAHFIEHMLFNGSERFPGQGVRDFLEKTGMKFGADVNAYTSWTETVYTVEVPADDASLTEGAAKILADWAQRASFDPKEIDKERGVIIEEDRLRLKNLNGRLMNAIVPAYFGDSRYAARLPIGDMAVVKRVQRDDFIRFYRSWYRPELMAVAAVGDAEVTQLQGQLEKELGALKALSGPPLPSVPAPLGNGPVYRTITDPEMPVVVGLITFKQRPRRLRTVGDYRERLGDSLFHNMVARRFDELAHSAGAPFQKVNFQCSEMAGVQFCELTLVSDAAGFEKAMRAAAGELERIRSQGFSDEELARAKKDLLRTLKEAYDKRDDTESAALRSGIIQSYLHGEPFTSAEFDYQAGEQLLKTLTAGEVGARAELFADQKNRIVLAIGPEKAKEQLPDEKTLASWFAGAAAAAPQAPQEEAKIESLMQAPPATAVSAEGEIPALGIRWFELANGVRVYVKKTDFVADQILFSAQSWGGASLVGDDDYLAASLASAIVDESGLGSFSRVALDRFLSDKNAQLTVGINDETESMRGRTDADDLETLLQLVYLHFKDPRRDAAAAKRVLERVATALQNRSNYPDAVFADAVNDLIYQGALRYTNPTPQAVRAVDPDRAYDLYRQRFANAADFRFAFVGDVDYQRLKDLAARYLGGLPASGERENYIDRLPPLPAGPKTRIIKKGLDQQARVWSAFVGEHPGFSSRKERFTLDVLRNALDIELLNKIREEESGTYSPQVVAAVRLYPRPRYRLGFSFSAAPQRLDALSDDAAALLRRLRDEGPGSDTLQKAKEQLKRSLEHALKTNEFWRGVIEDYYLLAYKQGAEALPEAAAEVDAVTAEDVRDLARRLMRQDGLYQVKMFPESK